MASNRQGIGSIDLPGPRSVSEAAERIRPYVVRTPLVHSPAFSELLGFPVWLKLENLQVTGAFKIRGATNALLILKRRGVGHVVTASSGSHAMGVALAARRLGLRATVVMAETSPEVKRRKVVDYGAELVVEGRGFDDSYRRAAALARDLGAPLVSGIDDETVMAGQGTMAMEILEDLPRVDFVAVPVGGGGAIGGVLAAVRVGVPGGHGRERGGAGNPRVWGVQAEGAPSMKVSLEKGEPTLLEAIDTIADAIAVRRPGLRPFEMVRRYADGVVTVPDRDMLRAAGRLALWAKVVAEPASAAPLAVRWDELLPAKPKAAAFIVTGGNIPPDLLLEGIALALH